MIYLKDNFIEEKLFNSIKNKLNSNPYENIRAGEKDFHLQWATPEFDTHVISKLEELEHRKLFKVFSYFRVSTDQLDTDWRIHSDLIINQQKPDRAAVLYFSHEGGVDLNGTAFWDHKVYGEKLPLGTTDEEYDRMITKEAENLDMWKLNTVVGYKQNRLVSYPANYFHSKYPNESSKEGRQIFVIFYKY